MHVFWLLIGVALLIIAVAYFFSLQNEKKRAEMLKAFAAQNNLPFTPGLPSPPTEYPEVFEIFDKGSGRKVTNLIEYAEESTPFALFDYCYNVSSGKANAKYNQTILMLSNEELQLPHFSLKPENFFHKFGSLLGMQDIDFDTHPEFSDQYLLKGEDEDAVREFFDEEKLNFFTQEKGWSVEGMGKTLLVYRHNKRPSADEMNAFVEEAAKVIAVFK